MNRKHSGSPQPVVPGGICGSHWRVYIDYSRASTTLLFDIRKKKWHQPFLEALDIPEEKLPRPEPSDAVVGRVTAEAGRLTGLMEGIPVIAGCMDTIGASIGSGVMKEGECFIIMGTAARVSGSLEKARPIHELHPRPPLITALYRGVNA
jgi:xylulokinase